MDVIQEAENLALKEMEKYGMPTPNEQELLTKRALELAEKLNADKTVILVGVWLMDVKLGEAWAENRVS